MLSQVAAAVDEAIAPLLVEWVGTPHPLRAHGLPRFRRLGLWVVGCGLWVVGAAGWVAGWWSQVAFVRCGEHCVLLWSVSEWSVGQSDLAWGGAVAVARWRTCVLCCVASQKRDNG